MVVKDFYVEASAVPNPIITTIMLLRKGQEQVFTVT